MKPNFRVLCGILLLCFASARSRSISDSDEILYEGKSSSYEARGFGNKQGGKDTDDYNLKPVSRLKAEDDDDDGGSKEADLDCKKECGEHPDIECVKPEDKVECSCKNNKAYVENERTCKSTCDEDEKCNGHGMCLPADGEIRFCKCMAGWTDDFCETEVPCESSKFRFCKGDNGTCIPDDTGVARCECNNEKKFDYQKNVCRGTCDSTKICQNHGECKPDNSGADFCVCKPGSIGDFCETVPACDDPKFKNCEGDIGACVLDDKGEATCNCKGGKKFDDGIADCRKTCDGATDCKNGAECKPDSKGTKFCECKSGSSGDTCEIVPACGDDKFKYCKGDSGTCVLDETDGARCECKKEKKFDNEINECRGVCAEGKDCMNGADCSADSKGTKFCKCKPGTIGDTCGTVPACDGPKFKDCKGDIGTCVFDDKNGARCECKGGKKFDDQISACRGTCDGDDKCNGHGMCLPVDGEIKFCKCMAGWKGDFCDIEVPCEGLKFRFCKGDNGTCIADNTGGARCECKNEKKFDGQKNICRDTCDTTKICQNGGECKSDNNGADFCDCKSGSIGDFCETIPACDDPKFKNCKGDIGTCVLDDKDGATCVCKGGKKFDNEIADCRTTCEDGGCKNAGTCTADASGTKFCKCRDGSNGDLCENVPACKNKKFDKCKEPNGTCVLGDNPDEGKCECSGKKKFDDKMNECRAPCEDCKNGGTCTAGASGTKFCVCRDGSSGDLCENVPACKDTKFDKCKEPNGTCVLGDNPKEAKCECSGENKFDDTLKECRAPCEDDGCKNGGTCTAGASGTKFCVCRDGSSGDLCDNVPACKDKKFDKCKEPNGTCVLGGNPKEAKCECSDEKKFDDTLKECRDQCDKDNTCDNGGTCKNKFCSCLKGTYGDMCKKVYDCLEGKYKNCSGERGSCEFDKEQTKAATCTCDGDKKFDPLSGYCRDVCKVDKDCKYKATCAKPTGAEEKFCKCNEGTTGDSCGTVVDCQEEKKFCGVGNDVECDYNEVKFQAECKCKDETKGFDVKEKICRKKCEKNEDCQADKEQCTDKLCICKDGLGDEDCTKALGCNETLTKICEAADAKCVYDEGKKEKATCKCSDDEYDEYDENERKCKPKFCMAAKCGAESECVFDKEKGVGICKCKDDEKYYDYKEHKCSVPDPCVLKKTSCKENEECSDGNCKCKKGFKKVNETCVSKMCDNKACLDVGDCKPVGDSYTCTCPEGKYFDGSKCADSSCIGKDFKTKCKTCVSGFTWDDKKKQCVFNEGTKLCDDECGYGYCIIENDKNTCRCITTVATEKKGKCVLKSSICASGKLTEDSSKCDCKGIYEDAEDKIACQLKTCTEKTQKECQAKRATCVMVKKGGKLNYDCKCQTGYVMDPVLNTCIDACSSQKAITGCYGKGQQAVCFNSESDLNSETGECECFPPLTNPNKNCSEIATDVYMIRNIPVLKKEYERNGEIDKVLLNAHLIQSMKQTFVKFKHGYLMDYKLSGNTLDCSIWIEFTQDATSQIKRIQQQVRTFNCTDCDTNLLLWPPHVLIASKDLNVVPEKLEFCSKDSKDKLCGKEALCANNTCSCPKGYTPSYMSRVITETYTIQRCEDIDECSTGTHRCPENTTCVNDLGDYHCECLPNFKKEKDTVFSRETIDKLKCVDMCTPNPCGKGDCKVKEKGGFDCSCSPGYGGTFCDRADVNFASAKKSAVTVGAILGTLLGVTLIAFFLYYRRVRKNSYSEDFAPASRGGEEMTERRPPMRGMINRSYE